MTWGPMGRGGDCPSCKKLTAKVARAAQARVALTDEWKKIHDQIRADRDRLAVENAELKATDQYQRALDEMHLRYNVESELAAANATLDALRETVQSDEWIYAKHTDTDGQMERIEDILDPQPKETGDV